MGEEEFLGLGFALMMEEERMRDEERRAANISAAEAYLQAEFPNRAVEEFTDPRRGGWGFRVGERGTAAVVADEFLEDTEPARVDGLLRGWALAADMRRAGGDMVVLVTRAGLLTEPARPR